MHDRPTRPAKAEGPYSRAIALSVERLGLIPFRAPGLSIAIALALAALASLEIERVKALENSPQAAIPQGIRPAIAEEMPKTLCFSVCYAQTLGASEQGSGDRTRKVQGIFAAGQRSWAGTESADDPACEPKPIFVRVPSSKR